MHAEKKEERKGPKVGEVWGDPEKPTTWGLIREMHDGKALVSTFACDIWFRSMEAFPEWIASRKLISKESRDA